jgi:hypothetical protein
MRWFDQMSAPAKAREVFASSVDAALVELSNRDAWFEVMTVALGGTENLDIRLDGKTWRVFPCADMLAVSTVVPGWARGWRSIVSDDVSYDQLTWFLHYARQYIHRSQLAKVLMTAWDRDGRVLHPFGPKGRSRFYGPYEPAPSMREMLSESVSAARADWGAPLRETRVTSIWSGSNTLDPSLHQAIFHFIRAHSLLRHEFELEAVVAFDCVLQAIKTLLVQGGLATPATSRGNLCLRLGLGTHAAEIAAEGHFLRNTIGAHAGGWRWWDSGEVTGDLVPKLSKLTRRVLSKAAALEPSIRRVDPQPICWSSWFLTNFDMLWTSVWFDKQFTR